MSLHAPAVVIAQQDSSTIMSSLSSSDAPGGFFLLTQGQRKVALAALAGVAGCVTCWYLLQRYRRGEGGEGGDTNHNDILFEGRRSKSGGEGGELKLFSSSWQDRQGPSPDGATWMKEGGATINSKGMRMRNENSSIDSSSSLAAQIEMRTVVIQKARAIRNAVDPVNYEWDTDTDSSSDTTDVSATYRCAKVAVRSTKEELMMAASQYQEVCEAEDDDVATMTDEGARRESLVALLEAVVEYCEFANERDKLKERMSAEGLHFSSGRHQVDSDADHHNAQVEEVKGDGESFLQGFKKEETLPELLRRIAQEAGSGALQTTMEDDQGDFPRVRESTVGQGRWRTQREVIRNDDDDNEGEVEDVNNLWEDAEEEGEWRNMEDFEDFLDGEDEDEEDDELLYGDEGLLGDIESFTSSEDEERVAFDSILKENLDSLAEVYGITPEDVAALVRINVAKQEEAREAKRRKKEQRALSKQSKPPPPLNRTNKKNNTKKIRFDKKTEEEEDEWDDVEEEEEEEDPSMLHCCAEGSTDKKAQPVEGWWKELLQKEDIVHQKKYPQ